MDSPKGKAADFTVAILAVISVVYFSFLPFLYILNYAGIDKPAGFLCILFSALAALAFRCLTRVSFDEAVVVLHALFVLFPVYALLRFSITGSPIDDGYFNIRTVVVVNALFFVLSLFCSQRKRIVLLSLFCLSSFYVLSGLYGLIAGKLTLDSAEFQNIFVNLDLEGGFYQNINVYLGLFVVLSLYVFRHIESFAGRTLLVTAIPFSLAVMFTVGGRAGLAAVATVGMACAVLGLRGSRTIARGAIPKALFAGLVLAALGLSLSDRVLSFVENSVTYRRFLVLAEGQDSSGRLFLFSHAIELFARDWATILFGVGTNGFPVAVGTDNTGFYPHNILLELAAEYGIIGILTFLAPVAYLLFIRGSRLRSLYGTRAEDRAVFLLALYFWVVSSLAGGLRSSWMLVFFTYLLFPTRLEAPAEDPSEEGCASVTA